MKISELYRHTLPIPEKSLENLPASPQKAIPQDFKKALEAEQSATQQDLRIQLSSHAATRIRSREIPWDPAMQARISKGMDSAEAKGSREALILAGNVAVIANVPSRTVITAMDSGNLQERVFTNIDSAVLV